MARTVLTAAVSQLPLANRARLESLTPRWGLLQGCTGRGDDDPGASFGVGPGVVMHEPDPEPLANGGQVVRLLAPAAAGELDCAEEWQVRSGQPSGRAAGGEDTPVERGVVGHQSGRPVQERRQSWFQTSTNRAASLTISHVIP